MKKSYIISAAMLFGAAALLSPMQADAKGAWRNMNHLLTNVSGCNGWNGMLTGSAEGVGEIFPGAGMVYQVVRDLPAGDYTLTANAFYRNGAAPEAAKLHFAGKETNNAYIFINDSEANIKSLFDGQTEAALFGSDGYIWGVVPNTLGEAAAAFNAGKYVNTVTAHHPGGDMIIGAKYLGKTEGQLLEGVDSEEWFAFSNFKLTGPNGDVALAADGKFGEWNVDNGWDVKNVANGNKGRGTKAGGVWSKTNASPYNHSQTITVPAGKYRVAVQSFNMHFLGAHPGYFIPMKGSFALIEGESAYDRYKAGATKYPTGVVRGDNPTVGDPTAPVETLEAYVYINEGEKINIGTLDPNTNLNVWLEPWTDEEGVEHPAPNAAQTKIKNLFEENLETYPETQNYKMADGNWKWVNSEGNPSWFESGHMREVAAFFVSHPDLYQNYAEIEVTGAENQITVGYNKDINQNNYSNPVFNFRLEKWDPDYEGYDAAGQMAVEEIEAVDENAPVEYYNLQGIRVANPENGIYIVKQGKKVSKHIFK